MATGFPSLRNRRSARVGGFGEPASPASGNTRIAEMSRTLPRSICNQGCAGALADTAAVSKRPSVAMSGPEFGSKAVTLLLTGRNSDTLLHSRCNGTHCAGG